MVTGQQLAGLYAARQYEQMLELLASEEGDTAQLAPEDARIQRWWQAKALHELGRWDEAISLYEELVAQNATKSTRGARILRHDLAECYRESGRESERARQLYLEVLEIEPDNPVVQNHLGLLETAEGRIEQAEIRFFATLALLTRRVIDEAKRSTSDGRLGLFNDAESVVRSILAIATEANDADQIERAMCALVQWRGAFVEVERIFIEAVRTAEADVRAAWEQVQHARRDLIDHLQGDPGPEMSYHLALSDQLTAELARAHDHFVDRFASDPVCVATDAELAALLHGTLHDLLAGLPADSALVCYVRLGHVISPGGNNEEHYGALVYRCDASTRWIPIGNAQTVKPLVDKAVGEIADDLGTAERDDTCLRQLSTLLLDPLRPFVDDVSHLVIAPIDTLWRVPFEALVVASGSPAIERWKRITFVAYPSEMRHWGSRRVNENQPAVFGVSEYRKFCNLPSPMGFPDLPGARAEAQRVASILGVEPICDDDANKSTVIATVRPSILHLAAHAEYDAETNWKFESYLNLFLTMSSNLRGPAYEAERQATFSNPMFRSMIALAGANALLIADPLPEAYGNGLLTAAEVELMDLRDTQLVVLSACKTVRGRAHTGPVRGLATAFVVAGVQSLVLSLWEVDDNATLELMISMYQRLKRGETLADALADTKMRIRTRFRRARDWAGFIVLGNPAALHGRDTATEPPKIVASPANDQ